MIRVHHLNNSRSQRVLWLLEELGLDYELVKYERDSRTMLAPTTLRRQHPLGKSPLLEDDGKVYAESGAIIQYLVDRHDAGRLLSPPPDNERRPRFDYWLHYAEGSAMPPLLLALVFGKVRSGPMPFFARPIAHAIVSKVEKQFLNPQLKLHFDYMEAELAESGWFFGETFSAADVMMSFPVEAGEKRVGYKSRPRLRQFLDAIHARPAYQRALQRGGPYSLLG